VSSAGPWQGLLPAFFVWGSANAFLVNNGWAQLPIVSLAMGFVGAFAVISTGVLLSKTELSRPIRYCGENSIVIYLAFFLFMASTRILFLKFTPTVDPGIMSLIVTTAGVIGPVLLFWSVRNTSASFLFRRPQWARLSSPEPQWHSAPHVEIARSQAR